MSSSHYKGSTEPGLVDDKTEGKVVIYPLALNIAWGGDGRYFHKGKERDPVELIQVSWIEIDGSYDLGKLKKGQKYKLKFVVSMKPDAFGWSNPVYVIARVKGGGYLVKEVELMQMADKKNIEIPESLEFDVPEDAASGDKLSFGLYEIWHNNWKGGLSIHKVIIEHAKPPINNKTT